MDQRTLQVTQPAADRYSGAALGVECAWPSISGAPAAVQGFLSSSPSPKRDPEAGGAFPLRVASVVLAALLLAVTPPASATPYAPEEYDFSDLSSMGPASFGIVESVREVPLRSTHEQLADVFEHSLNAETGDELIVRLDDGRAVTLRLNGGQRFQPGERVRLLGGRVLRT